jgi:hypothetical protein
MTAVLRPCEGTTFEALDRAGVPCGQPGRWWEAPSGSRFVLCEHHEQVFSIVAAETAAGPDRSSA